MLDAKTFGWPEAVASSHRARGLWREETFNTLLRSLVERDADALALVDGETTLTRGELLARSERLAAGFADMGLSAGDHVVLHLPNSSNFVLALFALSRLGVAPVLALPAHGELEISAFARTVNARAYIGAAKTGQRGGLELARTLTRAMPSLGVVLDCEEGEFTGLDSLMASQAPLPADPAGPENLFCLLLSGGSTGVPKLIPRLHCEYLCCIRHCALAADMDESTVCMTALPMAHNFPLAAPGLLGALMAGGRTIVSPGPDPDTCFGLMNRHGVTHTALVPPTAILWCDMAELLDRQESFPSLRLLQIGGARVAPDLVRRTVRIFGCGVQNVFGMSEGLVSSTRAWMSEADTAGSQGLPVCPEDEWRIVGPDGCEVPNGASGDLQIRGPYTIRSYFSNPGADAASFTEDGFFVTGDTARRNENGYLVVEGREKDQIQRCGEKITPEEVENMLVSHPLVADAVVAGVEDEELGERTCAFVRTRKDAPDRPDFRDLRKYLLERGMAAFKIPDQFLLIDSLPVTAVGKNNRRELRRLLVQQHGESLTKGDVSAMGHGNPTA